MNKGEKHMENISAIVFILGAILLIGSVYIYSRSDYSAYTATLASINTCKADIKRIEGLINSNIQSVALNNTLVMSLETKVKEVKEDCKMNAYDTDALNARCEKLKESQIDLQDKLSKKRPILKLIQPVSVDIVEKQESKVKSIIRESSKKSKDLQK